MFQKILNIAIAVLFGIVIGICAGSSITGREYHERFAGSEGEYRTAERTIRGLENELRDARTNEYRQADIIKRTRATVDRAIEISDRAGTGIQSAINKLEDLIAVLRDLDSSVPVYVVD
jgi:hypothetical protein